MNVERVGTSKMRTRSSDRTSSRSPLRMHHGAPSGLWKGMLDHPVAVRILAEVCDRDVESAAQLTRLAASAERTPRRRWPAYRLAGHVIRRTIGTLRVTLRARQREAC